MLWFFAAAGLALIFFRKGSRRHGRAAIDRLRRLHHEETDVDATPDQKAPRRSPLIVLMSLPSRFLPPPLKTKLGRDLEGCSPLSGMTIEELIGLRIWSAATLALGTLVIFRFSAAAIMLSLPAVALGIATPKILAAKKRDQYLDRIRLALPNAADVLYAFVLGGKNLDQAFRGTAEKSPEPLRPLLLQVVREMELGASRSESFGRLLERCPLPELSSLLRSLLEAEKRGYPLSGTLEVFSREIRLRQRDRTRVAVAKAPLKMLAPLVFLILPASLILTVGPSFLAALNHSL